MSEASPRSIGPRSLQLSHIQTSFTNKLPQQLQRPRPVEPIITEKPTISILPTQDVIPSNRRRSRGGLLALFGRGKSTTRSNPALDASKGSSERPEKPVGVQNPQASLQSRASILIPESYVPPPLSTTSMNAMQHRTTKTTLKPKMEKKDPPVRNLASWDPPELFKAYPQAVKHARLRAPASQVKAILQLHEDIKTTSSEQDIAQNGVVDHAKSDGARKKREKDKGFKYPASEMMLNAGWVDKLYLLATSGYLLEYAGDGAFDRLPEKVMPLGRESAAFASDAIPGEHWVLQVSRIANEDGILSSNGSKSMFKKWGFGNDLMRRTTSNYLIIFDRPEDMDSWLVVIRKQIEALGGRKYRPDERVHRSPSEITKRLHGKTSQRYLVKRDPRRFTNQTLEVGLEKVTDKNWGNARVQEPATITVRRPSTITQKSMDSPSLSNVTLSSDQACLDRLKESSRISYASAGTKTRSTSRGSSQEPSPARAAFSPEDLIPKPVEEWTKSHDMLQAQPQFTRQVFAPLSMPSQNYTADIRRESTLSPAVPIHKSTASRASYSPALNFSAPSFSNRYSYVTNPILLSQQKPVLNTNHHESSPPPASIEKLESLDDLRFPKEEPSHSSELVPQATQSAISKPLNIHDLSTFSRSVSNPNDVGASFPKSTRPVHRRFSSLDYTREVSPHHLQMAQSSSPHPPPTIALPALPRPYSLPDNSEAGDSGVILKGATTEETYKPRRPVSLQVLSDHIPRTKYRPPTLGLQDPSEMDEHSLSTPLTTIPKPTRAPPPPPLNLVKAPRVQSYERLPQIAPPLLGEPAPELPPQPDIPSFLNLENSPFSPLQGPWTTSHVGELRGLQDMKVN